MAIIDALHHGLIVSCQAPNGSPLRQPTVMAAMARAAELGGAVGIRAQGVEDIAAIKAVVGVPVIGIYKLPLDGFDILITPTLESAREIAAAGADIIALDATDRPRPDGLCPAEAIALYKRELGLPIMADISTLDEGIAAAAAGADIVATTMSGYTLYSPQQAAPDFDLISALAAHVQRPIIAEGRIADPADVRRAMDLGAHAVVVGTAITAIDWVTRRYVQALAGVPR